MFKSFFVSVIGLLGLLSLTQASRILGVFSSPSKSHLIIHSTIAETLAAAGHDVTVIGSFPNILPKAHYKYMQIEGFQFDKSFAQRFVDKPQPIYRAFGGMLSTIMETANGTMQHSKMQEFLRTHKAGAFDVLLLGYFMNDFMLGLGAHFQCPIVLSFMVRPVFALNTLVGNPMEQSYVPTLFGNFVQPMAFMDRVKNYLTTFMEHSVIAVYMKQKQLEMYR